MGGQLKRKFRVSYPSDGCLTKLQSYCKFSKFIKRIPLIQKPMTTLWNCHNNVELYVSNYGGVKISGYYLITDINDDDIGCAIYHSVWQNTYGDIVDITPFDDNRPFNMFCYSTLDQYYSGVYYELGVYNQLNPGPNSVFYSRSTKYLYTAS